eukprot:scaffold2156_cov115-Cylindrotheca_fusiformis.AAC.5
MMNSEVLPQRPPLVSESDDDDDDDDNDRPEEEEDPTISDIQHNNISPSSSSSSSTADENTESNKNSVRTSNENKSNDKPMTIRMQTPIDEYHPAMYIRSSGSAPPPGISWLQPIPNSNNDDDDDEREESIPQDTASPSSRSTENDDDDDDHQEHRSREDPPVQQTASPSSDPPGKKKSFGYQTTTNNKNGQQGMNDDDDDNAIQCSIAVAAALPKVLDIRANSHAKWIRSETHRRWEMSTNTIGAHRDQWSMARQSMEGSLHNLYLAERIVEGTAKAAKIFADNLQATAEDKFVDDQGNIVNSSFSQNRLSKSRRNSTNNNNNKNNNSVPSQQSPENSNGDDGCCFTLMTAISECQSVFSGQASQLEESTKPLLYECLPKLRHFKRELQEQVKETQEEGERLINKLDRSETEVLQTWDVFDSLLGEENGAVTGENGVESPRGKGLQDSWLAEMAYNAAVFHQNATVLKVGEELKKLYPKVESMEAQCLERLHSVLLDGFVRQQLKMFGSFPTWDDEMIEKVSNVPIDEESLESNLQVDFRTRWKESQSHRSGIMNRSSLSFMEDDDAMPGIENELGTPLESPTVLLAEVVELQISGGMGVIMAASWKRTISVVTKEGNVLFFELPKQGDPDAKEPLSAAFHSLCPDVEVEFSAAAKFNRRRRDLVGRLNPMTSWTLSKCSVDISQIQNKIVEVTEQGGHQSPRKRIFGGSGGPQRDVKHILRFRSAVVASKWVGEFEKTKGKLGQSAGEETIDNDEAT